MRKQAKGGGSNESLVTAAPEYMETHHLTGSSNTMTTRRQHSFCIWAIALVAVGVVLLTIKEIGTILFSDEVWHVAVGNYVPFVLWFNFMAG